MFSNLHTAKFYLSQFLVLKSSFTTKAKTRSIYKSCIIICFWLNRLTKHIAKRRSFQIGIYMDRGVSELFRELYLFRVLLFFTVIHSEAIDILFVTN